MDRAAFDAWLSALVDRPIDTATPVENSPYTGWDIFPRITSSSFNPL
jgi:hypothetical protein